MTSGAEQAAEAARQAKKNRPPDSKPPKQPSILGGVIAAVFTKETGMSRYSKLIGAVIGNVVGIAVVWLAAQGFATCTVAGAAESCTVFGLTTAQLTATVLAVFNSTFVWMFPPNEA